MDEYLCLTLLANPGEPEAAFKSRLTAFWSGLCRGNPDAFEKVYAETVACETHGDRLGRKYLVEATVVSELEPALGAFGMSFDPVDSDEVYSKYEATPPEWFWIEH